MTVKFCPKIDGPLGSIDIFPKDFFCSQNQTIPYTISVISGEPTLSLDGEFKIESDSVKTGDLSFEFDELQIDNFSIKETENGFTFKFSSNFDKIDFKIIVSDFASLYEAQLTVDATSNGFGSDNSKLVIEPIFEFIQADNFDLYAEELGIQLPPEQQLDTDIQKFIPTVDSKKIQISSLITENFSLINNYNFYLQDYEQTSLDEKNLLNINLNYISYEIKRYFDKKPESFTYSNNLLHSSQYMKETYPLLDEQKFLFPMYIELKFKTDNTKTLLTSFLEKLGLLEYFCYYYVFNFKNLNTAQQSLSFNTFKDQILNTIFSEAEQNIKNNFIGLNSKIKNFLNRSFQKTILIKLLEKQIEKLPQFKANQILMYKLDKFKNNVLLNTQYFINKFENSEIICFDTQLKYNVEYEYKISKIEILQDGTIVENVISEYSAKTKIIDNPPLPPDVSYIPYKGIDDKILINFNANIGSYIDYPVIIQKNDISIFNNILNNSNYSRNSLDLNKVQFESDDINIEYQLFRIEKAPSSYKDFENSYELKTKNTSILDTIKPNIKYYYIARTIDVHGNISNPTKPIQLEMINENGTIYLIKKEYNFEEEEKIISNNFKNILQLKPSKQQIEINRLLSRGLKSTIQNSEQINLVLGNKEVSLWNKPFLMRITSKMTGKKMDIKFKFTYSQPK